MSTTSRRALRWPDWLFTATMLVLAGTCIFLGHWQMERLAEKETLIAAVDTRLDADPVPVPPAADWAGLDLDQWNFQPVTLTGTFRTAQTLTVFTSLADPRGPLSGPGYWVMTPFELTEGGTVFINRGFVPDTYQEAAVMGNLPGLTDEQTMMTGLLRPGEPAGFMVPEPNMSARIEWVRDPVRMAAMVDPALQPIAPFYVDMQAGPAGELPQAGETKVSFTNNHLGYALTWYGFAIVAVVMLGFWLWRQTRPLTPSA